MVGTEPTAAWNRSHILGASRFESRIETKGALRQVQRRPEPKSADEALKFFATRILPRPRQFLDCEHGSSGSGERDEQGEQQPGTTCLHVSSRFRSHKHPCL